MSVSASPVLRSNLPLLLAPMIGREGEQDELRALLLSPRVRLVTLTGPGGVGKTRLAVEVGRTLASEFTDGLSYIALDPIRDEQLVLPTIAQAIGLNVTGREAIASELSSFLADRSGVLILDNFEQVEGAAPDIVHLLAACQGIKVLATSRTPLGMYGEREFPVAPLPLFSSSDPLGMGIDNVSAAVQLFVERAMEVQPRFSLTSANMTTVVEICRRLDGLPLAIELAAARIKALSPETLLARLSHSLQVLTSGPRDLPPRLRTMRDAIAWSHDLLSDDERILFRRLAVFTGSFSLEAVEQGTAPKTGDGEQRASEMLDLITSLVDESLVLRSEDDAGETRYSMYQTIFAFAQEHLLASGEEHNIREAHAQYFCSFAERAVPELIGFEQNVWLERLERDHDNLRAALTWALDHQQVSLAQRLGGALWRFWWVRGHVLEGSRWFARILALNDNSTTLERGMSIFGAAAMAEHLGDYDRAPELYRAALQIARTGGHRCLTAKSIEALGLVAQDQGRYDEAVALHQEARAIFAEIGNRRGLISTTHNLGSISYYRGDIVDAEERYTEALHLIREIGDRRGMSMVLGNLGVIALARGDFGRAKLYQEESLSLNRVAKDTISTGVALTNLADAERYLGNYEQAETLYREALGLFEAIGAARLIATANIGLGLIAQARGDNAHAVEHLTRALTLAHEGHDSAATATCLEALAIEALALGEPVRATRLLGAAESLRSEIGSRLTGVESEVYDRNVAAVKAANDPARFALVWAEGAAVPREQMVREASTIGSLVISVSPDSPADVSAARELGLTRRELDVLRRFVAGDNNADIAEALAIPLSTVTTIVGNLYTKLAVDSRAGVTATAFKHGLV